MGHSPKKKIKTMVERLNKDSIREEDGRHKGKLPYITSIIVGAPRFSMSPKGAIKRKIAELMAVSIKRGVPYPPTLKGLSLNFETMRR